MLTHYHPLRSAIVLTRQPINVSSVFKLGAFFVCGEGPRSRCYGRTAALWLLVQPCDEDG
jgi:hypothetical protein